MELNLKRPIIFFDLETTGIDIARDRIVEISMVKVMPDGEEIVRTRRINPGMPIPAEATAIHGITDEDVKDCPLFRKLPSRWPSLSRDATSAVSIRTASICRCWSRSSCGPVWTWISANVNSSTCRISFTKWSSGRWWRPISSIAARISRMPIGRGRYVGDIRGAESPVGPLRGVAERCRGSG